MTEEYRNACVKRGISPEWFETEWTTLTQECLRHMRNIEKKKRIRTSLFYWRLANRWNGQTLNY